MRNRGANNPLRSQVAKTDDLSQLADQLAAIANHLRKYSGEAGETVDARFVPSSKIEMRVGNRHAASVDPHYLPVEGNAEIAESGRPFAGMAAEEYRKRRSRNAIFGEPDLFGEPAWDILLDLYVAWAEGTTVSVSSACIGSAAPPTTGLRWLGVLCEQGLTVREHDPGDQRRVLVRLTEKGIMAMNAYFTEIA